MSTIYFFFSFLFLFSALPEKLMKEIAASEAVKHIKSFVEVNTAFIPYESQVGVTEEVELDGTVDKFFKTAHGFG